MNETEQRLNELEIRLALQDDLLDSLNRNLVRIQQTLELQQSQLRLLYQKMQHQQEDNGKPYSLADEIPPHY